MMNAQNKMTVTVSITTFNRPDSLLDCLRSLEKQTYKNFDVIIVNGGDAEGVAEVAAKSGLSYKIVQQKRKGLVEARNLCWRESHSDIVCIIDDDLVVSPNWLDEIIKTFKSDEAIGGVTGPTVISKLRSAGRDALSLIELFEKGNIFWRVIGKFYFGFIMEGKVKEIGKILKCGTFTLGSNYPGSAMGDKLIDVDYLEACHMCLRRGLIEKVGGFDHCYTGTGEWHEPDLAFKIRKLGYRLIFNQRAATEHRVSQQGVFHKRTFAFERSNNFIKYYFKNFKPRSLQALCRFYFYLLFMNCYWFYKALISKNVNWLSGIFGTFYGLFFNLSFKRKKHC